LAVVPAREFATSVDRLMHQVGHWELGRWSARPAGAPPAAPSRSDTVYALVQRLADLCADAEQRPHRRVPRLSDLVLRDQLRVMADDLLRARGSDGRRAVSTPSDEVLRQATEAVDAVRRAL
jgi:hypothetical protein